MEGFIPCDVMSRMIHGGSALRAWREYLGLSQIQVAVRLGMQAEEYARHEVNEALWRPCQAAFAKALGIEPEQLEI
jgi:transcriptional regulator with XRE-family HTH domain